MTPTPDTKKIAAEMREIAVNLAQAGGNITASRLERMADTLDPQPMGIEEAIEVLRNGIENDAAILATKVPEVKRIWVACKTAVAHYEARDHDHERWIDDLNASCADGHQRVAFTADTIDDCPLCEAIAAPTRKTGELVTELRGIEKEAIRVASCNLDPDDFNVTVRVLKKLAARCVVRP